MEAQSEGRVIKKKKEKEDVRRVVEAKVPQVKLLKIVNT